MEQGKAIVHTVENTDNAKVDSDQLQWAFPQRSEADLAALEKKLVRKLDIRLLPILIM